MDSAVTFLNGCGDITITWTESEDETIRQMLEQKMEEGYSFFIVEDGFLGKLMGKRTRLKKLDQLGDKRRVFLDDKDLENLFKQGKVNVYSNADDSGQVETKGKLKSPKEWLKGRREEPSRRRERLVGVRQAAGG